MNGFADENTQIGIDFDGVIHKNSKGFHDGTIYDEPIEGVEEALKTIASKYTIVLYTAKAKADRPLVDGKTGAVLVLEWLQKYKLDQYVAAITAEKPRAVAYIDDKGIRFNNWQDCLAELNTLSIL
jgi:hypothetical protein